MTGQSGPSGATASALLTLTVLLTLVQLDSCQGMSVQEKRELREQVLEMFNHGYGNYMEHAYPADELMPLTCQGRSRGTHPTRGDVDDCLGNFSLTLVDTLDTLVVLGQIEEFEHAVTHVINDVSFDRDVVVSVFETNIRMLGGLLGGHVMAEFVKDKKLGMQWYRDELLELAKDLGYRLLPAFNTTTGIPFPRVNLRYGVKAHRSRTGHEKDTCTACAGSMILEFAALSRLTGESIFETKAAHAMDSLWQARHRTSDLVGTVINIHNGDWVRRDSGVGAGIDSYYEYLLKAYILLGDEIYLDRFNKHYAAIMKYINQGPMLVDVHMHKPLTNSRHFMDALMGFWPGLQVLKGDIKPAIEIHEMLYQVTRRHNFLPEAFTTDFRVHWGQHPLRPEFVESTYFIYKATGDPYYLDVGKTIIDNLNQHARVKCGFAAIRDVTTGTHEDQMDSYVLAETFKYLYLLFSEREDLLIDVDDYVFTTEAHLLPLSVAMQNSTLNTSKTDMYFNYEDEDELFERSCPNGNYLFRGNVNFAQNVRSPLKNYVNNLCPKAKMGRRQKLHASTFMAGNLEQVQQLKQMGIRIVTMNDGRVQLLHTASEASSPEDAEDGMLFMQEMIELSKTQQEATSQEPRILQFVSPPYFGNIVLNAGPAQFGHDLKLAGVQGKLVVSQPYSGCQVIQNAEEMKGKFGIVQRGDCMFIDKARQLEAAGAIGGVVVDNNEGTNSETQPLFAMSGDGKDGVKIPMVFLFHTDAVTLLEAVQESKHMRAYMGHRPKSSEDVMKELLAERNERVDKAHKEGKMYLDDQEEEENKVKSQYSIVTDPDTAQSSSSETSSDEGIIVSARAALNEYLQLLQDAETAQGDDDDEDDEIVGPDSVKVNQGATKAKKDTSGLGEKAVEVFEELVKLLMVHTEVVSQDDNENLKLYNLGKVIQSSFMGNDKDAGDILSQLALLRKHASAAKGDEENSRLALSDEVQQEINEALEDYVNNEINRVMEETEKLADGKHYAGAEDFEGECPVNTKVDTPTVRKAPESMNLQEGEIYIDGKGNIFTKDGLSEGEGDPAQTELLNDNVVPVDAKDSNNNNNNNNQREPADQSDAPGQCGGKTLPDEPDITQESTVRTDSAPRRTVPILDDLSYTTVLYKPSGGRSAGSGDVLKHQEASASIDNQGKQQSTDHTSNKVEGSSGDDTEDNQTQDES